MKKKDKYKWELVELLSKIAHDKTLLDEFLKDLFTPKEYQDIVKRWQIVKQLNEGITQREIAQDLKVGIVTISRGSKELLNKNGGFNKVLKKYYNK